MCTFTKLHLRLLQDILLGGTGVGVEGHSLSSSSQVGCDQVLQITMLNQLEMPQKKLLY